MNNRLINALNEIKKLEIITFGKIIEHANEEALLILCLIAILPFMQPIPIPGVSTILALIILLQGVGLIFWGKPLLTKRLKQVVISHQKFTVIEKAGIKFTRLTSKISALKHPYVNSRISQIVAGISMILSSIILSLPLPIPLTNLIPALSIFFLCIGLLEEDLILLLVGHGITLTVIWMTIFSYQIILEYFQNWF